MCHGGDRIALEMPGRFENIDLFQFLSEELGELCGFDQDGCFWIGLALREALNNAILHGNRKDLSKMVFVKFEVTPDALGITVRDEGQGFSPEAIPDPLKPQNLMNTSGRGIFYIKNFMDSIDFSAASGRGGEIRMVKRRVPGSESGGNGKASGNHKEDQQ